MTQATLAKTSGIHPTWISHLEGGKINITWANARRLADGLRVTLGELADKAMEYEDPTYEGRAPDPPLPPDLTGELDDLAAGFRLLREEWEGITDMESLYASFVRFHRRFDKTFG